MNNQTDFDVIIVGAGWGGMYMLHQCRKLGLTARVLEAGPSVGGTWYWNRYPGLHCDVESVQYSYSFDRELQQEWNWTERYASQPEILRYANHVADRFDLRRDISFNTRVAAVHHNDQQNTWKVRAEDGRELSSRFVVMATGCLSSPKKVNIPGIDSFKGQTLHTAFWPETPVDFTGKRVGIIGTGSSGIQSIPKIAEQAKQFYVFQRTPSYSIPAANKKLEASYTDKIKGSYDELRHEARHHLVGIPAPTYAMSIFEVDEKRRKEILDHCYDNGLPFALMVAFADVLVSEEANKVIQDYLANRIRERVKDPEIAEQLIPTGQFAGTRRLCIDTNYYETFNRPNVTLKNLARNPIDTITEKGVKLKDGEETVPWIMKSIRHLGPTLGPLLFQLPPRFKLNLQRLESFLKILPPDVTSVFEFRDPSWYDDATFALLDRYGASFVAHDMPGSKSPRVAVGPIAYIRFHGGTGKYSGRYPDDVLTEWADWIARQVREGRAVWAYFNNDAHAHAIHDAQTLRAMVRQAVQR